MGNQGGKALKRLPAHFNFSGSVSTSSGCFVPKFGVGRGTEAFIYALSADETSPALAALRHAITALFSCRFKCPCPPRRQWRFHGNADRAYNTLHFAPQSRVPNGALPPLETPATNRCYAPSREHSAVCCQQPVSRSACSSL